MGTGIGTELMTRLRSSLVAASLGISIVAPHSNLTAQAGKLLVFQNAMGGDAVTIIDTETNRVVGEIPDIEIANGLATSPDGGRLYVTGEVAKALYVVDTGTMAVVNKVATIGRPSAVAVSKDGRRIYVGVQDQGATGLDIFDASTLILVKNLPLEGMQSHYVLVTPDGKYVAVTANQGRSAEEALTVRLVDTETEEYVRKIVGLGGGGHRVCDFYPNADGSTRWLLCNQGGLPGFVVYDFNTGKIVQKVTYPVLGGGLNLAQSWTAQSSPSHGVAVTPDNETILVSDRWYNLVHLFSAPDMAYVGAIPTGPDPFWFSVTPDNRTAYVSNSLTGSMSVLDLVDMREIARIPVQNVPKRNIMARVP